MANLQTNVWEGVFVPRWAADFRSRDHLIPGGVKLDPGPFPYTTQVTVTVGAAGAALNAETIPLSAVLPQGLPSGTVLQFTGGELARLSRNARKGEAELHVFPLAEAIEAADTATFSGDGRKGVPSGAVLGCTAAELSAGAPWGPAADTDDFVRILAFGIDDVSRDNDGVLYRPGSVVKENLLPEWATLSAAVKTKVQTAYVCQRGIA